MSAAPAIRIDTHAHAFTSDCAFLAGRQYTPERDAPLAAYLALLDDNGVSHGVLTQPSFLGADNGFLLECLKRAKGRLRGIAVVAPDTGRDELDRLAKAGIVGIRVNLVRGDPVVLGDQAWQGLFHRVAALTWQVEVYALSADIPGVLDALRPSGARVVIDHFGRPDPELGLDDPGFKALLAGAAGGRLWVKLSGPYRLEGGDVGAYAGALMEAFGPKRLVWGSDWPWTLHGEGKDYGDTLAWLGDWVPDAEARAEILGPTPFALFGFADDIEETA
ncbi:MAG: amidohydrolase [Alphaproteobacteria bacterium]